jgi:hypothetical protein
MLVHRTLLHLRSLWRLRGCREESCFPPEMLSYPYSGAYFVRVQDSLLPVCHFPILCLCNTVHYRVGYSLM